MPVVRKPRGGNPGEVRCTLDFVKALIPVSHAIGTKESQQSQQCAILSLKQPLSAKMSRSEGDLGHASRIHKLIRHLGGQVGSNSRIACA